MPNMVTDQILRLTEIYAQSHGLTASTVATYSMKHGAMYARLRRGHDSLPDAIDCYVECPELEGLCVLLEYRLTVLYASGGGRRGCLAGLAAERPRDGGPGASGGAQRPGDRRGAS